MKRVLWHDLEPWFYTYREGGFEGYVALFSRRRRSPDLPRYAGSRDPRPHRTPGHAYYCDCGDCMLDGNRAQWQRRGMTPMPLIGPPGPASVSPPPPLHITIEDVHRHCEDVAERRRWDSDHPGGVISPEEQTSLDDYEGQGI